MYPVNLWLQKNQNDSQVTMAQQSLRSLFRFKSVTLSPVFNASCRACRSQLPMQSRLGGGGGGRPVYIGSVLDIWTKLFT